MLADISDRLTRVIEKRRLKRKLEQDLAQVERDLGVKTRLLETLAGQLKKEQVDVEKLEHLSLMGLFYSALGSREQQVEKERQELLAAELKYQQAKRTLDSLRADRAHIQGQLDDLRGVEDEYASLMVEKEQALCQAKPQTATELERVSGQIANRGAEKREIDEAITAANGVIAGLDQVIDSLESASGWGAWDMLGGGFLSTAIKHSRIDDARDAVQDVQAKMNRFTRELADVQRSTELKIDIGDLDIFADYFFDSLIVDWIVQSKITRSLEQAQEAKGQITRVAADLGQMKAEVQRQVDSLVAQRASIVEQA